MQGFVYILQSKRNDRYYVGSTNNVDRRKSEHDRGNVVATRSLRPLELVFQQVYPSLQVARQMEHWLKRLKDRRILDKIIIDGRIQKEL